MGRRRDAAQFICDRRDESWNCRIFLPLLHHVRGHKYHEKYAAMWAAVSEGAERETGALAAGDDRRDECGCGGHRGGQNTGEGGIKYA